jgi:C1A family cysteine protease
MTARKYGWHPDLPDFRDHLRKVAPPTGLPVSVDMRAGCPPVYDQGDLGSCTANAIAGAVEFDLMKQKLAVFAPSRLFVYYNERAVEGSIASDSGAAIRDGIKSVNTLGVPPETDWPYIESQFAVKPPPKAYQAALLSRSLVYQSVGTAVGQCKSTLAAGSPVVIGFTVYDSFESDATAETGIMTMPAGDESVLGGHAVLMVGYSDVAWKDTHTGHTLPPGFIVRNSWGGAWGLGGYFIMPYGYVTPDLMDDFWTVEKVA